MKNRINSGRETFTYQGISIDGFNVYVQLISDLVNVLPLGINLNEVRVRAILEQSGQKIEVIPSTTLAPLLQHYYAVSNSDTPSGIQTTGLHKGTTTVTETVALQGQAKLVVPVRFTGGIVLKGSDKISFEIAINGGAFDATNDVNSFIEVEPNEVVTNQLLVPRITVFPIGSNLSNFRQSLGNNVQAITIMSIDKGLTDSVTPFTNIELKSDRLSYDRTFQDHRVLQLSSQNSQSTYNVLTLLRGTDFDEVTLNVALATANITNGMCWCVVSHYDVDDNVLFKGTQRQAKHAQRMANKFHR